MNRSLGRKWFIFYTKIRPIIMCVTSLGLIVEFLRYPGAYFGDFGLLLYFVTCVTQLALGILVMFKSKNDYERFVPFVKGVLGFEVFAMAYGVGVDMYISHGSPILGFGFMFILGYFIWYKLNVKYFERRLLFNSGEVKSNKSRFTECPRCGYIAVFEGECPQCKYKVSQVPGAETAVQRKRTKFCRKCGSELIENSRFCGNCGTAVIEKAEG